MSLNTIVRRGSFDAGHRILFQRFKCGNLHGHRYEYELEFRYETMLGLGYAIDFSELKRIACAWIDDHFDHGFIVNPRDDEVLRTLRKENSKHFVMHLTDESGSCNPTAENVAKELFFGVSTLIDTKTPTELKLARVTVYETANCVVNCRGLTAAEYEKFSNAREHVASLADYKKEKGTLEYDSRKV